MMFPFCWSCSFSGKIDWTLLGFVFVSLSQDAPTAPSPE